MIDQEEKEVEDKGDGSDKGGEKREIWLDFKIQ